MSEQLKALYALQQVDSRLEEVRRESAALDSGEKLRAQIAAAEVQNKKLQDELRKAEADLQDAELKLKSLEQKKAAYEKKLYGGGGSPKELSGIEKEIEILSRQRAQLDEQILGLYELVDQRKAALSEFEGRLAAAAQRLEKITANYTSESARLKEEIAKLEDERSRAAAGIQAALLRRYDSIRARSGGIGIAKVSDGKCGGCHIGLTSFLLRKLKEDAEMISCENCGRFLLAGDE